jgi:hypothetical protein
MFLFPDVAFDESKFFNLPGTSLLPLPLFLLYSLLFFNLYKGRFYADLNNRREVFNKFARKKGFDPLVAEKWYNVPRQDILATKV